MTLTNEPLPPFSPTSGTRMANLASRLTDLPNLLNGCFSLREGEKACNNHFSECVIPFLLDGKVVANPKWNQNFAEWSQWDPNRRILEASLLFFHKFFSHNVGLRCFNADTCYGDLGKTYWVKGERGSGKPPSPIVVKPEEDKEIVARWGRGTDAPPNPEKLCSAITDAAHALSVRLDVRLFEALDTLVPEPSRPSVLLDGFFDSQCLWIRKAEVRHIENANRALRNAGFHPDLIVASPAALADYVVDALKYDPGTDAEKAKATIGHAEYRSVLISTLCGNTVAWSANLRRNGQPSSTVTWVMDSDESVRYVFGHPISLYGCFADHWGGSQSCWPPFNLLESYTRVSIFLRNLNGVVKILLPEAVS